MGFLRRRVFPFSTMLIATSGPQNRGDRWGGDLPINPRGRFEKIIIFDLGMAEKPARRFAASVQFWRAKSAGSGPLPGNRAGQSGSAVAQGYPGTMPTGWYGHSPPYMVRHAV